LIVSALWAFIIGYKVFGIIIDYDVFSSNPQHYLLSWQGSWVAAFLSAAISAFYTWYQKHLQRLDKPAEKKETIRPHHLTANILMIAALFGILGAKLFDVLEHLDQFWKDPLGTIFSFSGLAFYGGFILAAFAVGIYAHKHHIPWPHIADAVAPALMIAYAVGRIGCQLSGDGCWGIPHTEPKPEWLAFLPDWMWAFNYPHNVINEGVPLPGCHGDHCFVLPQAVYPTPFYETSICTFFFIILWSLRKKIKTPGYIFCIYLILSGIERFYIEKIRVNIKYHWAGLEYTQAQLIAIALIIVGIAGFFVLPYIKMKKNPTK
jgi:prolipoprotein diacylglyceryl transferase